MAVMSQQVSVGTSGFRLDSGLSASTALVSLLVRNRGTVAVYVGGSGVTTGNGFQLDPGESMSIDLRFADAGVYALAASGTQRVDVMQAGG